MVYTYTGIYIAISLGTYRRDSARAVGNSDGLALSNSVLNTIVAQGRRLGTDRSELGHYDRRGDSSIVVLPDGGGSRVVDGISRVAPSSTSSGAGDGNQAQGSGSLVEHFRFVGSVAVNVCCKI